MQAARGASLNPSDQAESVPARRRVDARLVFAGVALVAYAVDLGSKQWALTALADGDIAVLGDWFTLHLTSNPGAAFSTGTGFTIVFTCLAMVAVVVVLDGESPWTRAELNEVVKELKEHQERLTAIVGRSEEELARLMRDAGDGAGHDQADVGATSFERDHELTVLARERETLGQIDQALAHIDDGTYGVCDSCGNPIGKNRLMAVPHATLCMSCKQREERR